MDQPDRNGPPFYFDGVTTRVFPLRAHVHALQRLCDVYLNRAPDVICFRPAAPYVMLAVLNYGRMSSATERAAHFGWVSQNEVYFGVPLDWAVKVNGQWTRGSGVVAPFIFVDQAWSIAIGREVFGWPKQPAAFQRELNTWAIGSPAARETLLTVATETFVTPYAGTLPCQMPLIEINRAAPLSIGPALWQAPITIDNLWGGALTLWREAMRSWLSVSRRDPARDLQLVLQYSRLLFGGSSPQFYTANLKQVRDLEDPALAAYQAITMAPMRLSSLHRAGLLGEGRLALGDPTGGYRIRIHRHPLFPIIETLGLLVSSEERYSGPRDIPLRGYTAGDEGDTRLERFPSGLTASDDHEHGVATVAPLFPFWLEADLEYGRESFEVPCRNAPPPGGGVPPRPFFDLTWGSRAVPTPPYYYPQTTVRVLTLQADESTLSDFIKDWNPPSLPPDAGTVALPTKMADGTAWKPSVLMMVTTSEKMGAQTNSAGWWWQRQVAFYIPVCWTRPNQPLKNEGQVNALFQVITFADSKLAAIAGSEMGPEMIAADLSAPPDSWLSYGSPRADRALLWLATNTLPAIDVGAEATQRVILEVIDAHKDMPPPLGPYSMSDVVSVPVLAKRQIRDTKDPYRFVYEEWFSQNLICKPTSDWRRTSLSVELRIHQYPDRLDLVKRLALKDVRREQDKSRQAGRGWGGVTVNVIDAHLDWGTVDITYWCNTSLAVRYAGQQWISPERSPMARDLETRYNEERAKSLVFVELIERFLNRCDPPAP